jgi:hypothetical protein
VDLFFNQKSSTQNLSLNFIFFSHFRVALIMYGTVQLDPMARSKKQPDRHQQKTVSFRLPEPLVEKLRVLAKRNRRTLSGEAQMAFENHLGQNGLWSGDASSPSTEGKESSR